MFYWDFQQTLNAYYIIKQVITFNDVIDLVKLIIKWLKFF